MMAWYNPFSWIKEDPVTRCGWYGVSVYRNPKKDPYYNFCSWDDSGTTKGSFASKAVPLERWIENGIDQISLLQASYPVGSWEWELGEFYKKVWPHLVPLFWEGKK